MPSLHRESTDSLIQLIESVCKRKCTVDLCNLCSGIHIQNSGIDVKDMTEEDLLEWLERHVDHFELFRIEQVSRQFRLQFIDLIILQVS